MEQSKENPPTDKSKQVKPVPPARVTMDALLQAAVRTRPRPLKQRVKSRFVKLLKR